MLRFTTAAAVLGLSTAFAQPVLADKHGAHADMTCADFIAMNEEDRGMAYDALAEAGRDGAREEARGDDGGSDGMSMAESDTDAQDVDGGREEAREEARGEDMVAVMTACEADPNMKVSDVMMHPTDK